MTTSFRRFLADESGATAIEYGLIAALVSVVIIVALGMLGGALDDIFQYIAGELQDAAPDGGGTGTGG